MAHVLSCFINKHYSNQMTSWVTELPNVIRGYSWYSVVAARLTSEYLGSVIPF